MLHTVNWRNERSIESLKSTANYDERPLIGEEAGSKDCLVSSKDVPDLLLQELISFDSPSLSQTSADSP